MKNSVKKSIAMLLAVIMLVSIISVAAAADAKPAVGQYDYYTILGDSNASAYGLDAYFEYAGSTESVKDDGLIPGSYASIVADAIDAKTVDCRSHCAWRTSELLRMLGADVEQDKWSSMYLHSLGWVGDDVLNGEDLRIQNAVAKADFITLDFGSNDIYTHAINRTTDAYPNLLSDLTGGPETYAAENGMNNLFAQLMLAAEKAGILADVVASFKAFIADNMENYKTNITRVVQEIRARNDHAKIVLLGIFCPVSFDIKSGDGTLINFISSSDIHVRRVNNWLRDECPVRDQYTFVNREEAECFGLPALDFSKLVPFDENIKYSAVKMVHPTEKGHRYIANQIINALESEDAPDSGYTRRFSIIDLIIYKLDLWNSFKNFIMKFVSGGIFGGISFGK